MNIIIPIGGKGQRFVDDNYSVPKPLIKVLGEPIIFKVIRSLKVNASTDKIYVPYNIELDRFGFKNIVHKEFPNVIFVPLNYPTRGAVETVLCALQKVDDLKHSVLVCDGDTFYEEDIVKVSKLHNDDSCIFCFDTKNESPIFSYIKLHKGVVTEIKEKDKISDLACSGAYFFGDGHTLKKYSEKALNEEKTASGEYYISGIYDLMLRDGKSIFSYVIENFHCLGTPHQLKAYCMGAKSESDSYKRFCFDLDGTLCTFPDVKGNYSTVHPVDKNIKKLKHLHGLGHTIIIQTARGMGSNFQNEGVAIKRNHKEVFKFLELYDIPYDEIYFGKPQADFYVDDLAISPFSDLDKETGFYDGKVEARKFNKVTFDHSVLKESNNPGEWYWYKNIPQRIKQHFPVCNTERDFSVTPNIDRMRMEKIKGVPFNYLFVNGSLTKSDIDLLFSTMDKIHKSEEPEFVSGRYYKNYCDKLMSRFTEHEELYKSLDSGVIQGARIGYYTNKIMDFLRQYEDEGCADIGVIHGDPVFSNIFLCENRLLKFIDMRGMQGDVKTIFGDIFYDYAKIYQSLSGYDRILLNGQYNLHYETELRQHFEDLFIAKFGMERMISLKLITASHLFSLIPLHDDFEKQKGYFNLMTMLF